MEQMVVVGGNQGTRDLGRVMTETLEAAKTLSAEDDSGKVFFLKKAAGFTITLPSIAKAKAGWFCRMIVMTAPTTSGGYVITELAASDTDKIKTNGIVELEVDTGTDGLYNAGHTTVTLVHDLAVAGDQVEFLCDGVNWHCKGHTNVDGGAALA